MSLYIDITYLNRIGPRLPKFKKKADYLWNCRCVICGDSQTNPNRARGFFYRTKGDLFYKCHNCQASKHFGTFLKDFDEGLYQEYCIERYAKGEIGRAHAKWAPELTFRPPNPAPTFRDESLDALIPRLSTLSDDNEAVAYCLNRQVPREALRTLRFLPRAKDLLEILPERYQESEAFQSDLPKLVFPLYDGEHHLTGFSLRTLRDESVRYILAHMIEDAPLIFGIERAKFDRHLYVVEGAMDSLFLPNAIAMNGVGFAKVETLGLDRSQYTLVLDNQPRNRQVVRELNHFAEEGYRVVVWPPNLPEKDINEMILAGKDPVAIMEANTHQGIAATAAIIQWRRCE